MELLIHTITILNFWGYTDKRFCLLVSDSFNENEHFLNNYEYHKSD